MRVSYAVRTALLWGVEARPVIVEVNVSQGIPGVTIVGMGDMAVQEARHRVRCAFRECGFEWPRAHLTINLAPSELKKMGTSFDLPIAVAILACTGQIPTKDLDSCLFVGELALSGQVCPVRGLVAYDLLADEQGLTFVGPEGSLNTGECQTLVIRSLAELKQGIGTLSPVQGNDEQECLEDAGDLDFADVLDQEIAKRAFVIAATGDHGLLMVGPPGAGKSMMAKRMPSILSPLKGAERAEALLIHSVAGQDLDALRRGKRPFRSPHHAISTVGLVGGGRPVHPGEISLAHNGVLYLDELPQFGPGALQSLRQPLEDGVVHVVRVDGTYTFPCDFLLIAAANPCPCGYLGDPDHTCTCGAAKIQAYQSRIGGPLMDRFDMLVDVARPSSAHIISGERGTSSALMAEQVSKAREYGSWRRSQDGDGLPDKKRSVPELSLSHEAQVLLEGTANRLALGGRNIVRIARVARTIADLDESRTVEKAHVIEACAFRTRTTL